MSGRHRSVWDINPRANTRTYLKTSKLPEDEDGRELDEAEEVDCVVLPATSSRRRHWSGDRETHGHQDPDDQGQYGIPQAYDRQNNEEVQHAHGHENRSCRVEDQAQPGDSKRLVTRLSTVKPSAANTCIISVNRIVDV